MVALLLAGYLLFLYAPHLVFKFAAANRYDFMVRKELPQVEEFFSAGLPSALLNFIAWAALRPSRYAVGFDRHVIGTVFAKDPDLKAYFESGNLHPLVWYLAALFAVSWLSGRFYGNALRTIVKAGGPEPYFSNAPRWWWAAIVILYRRLWRSFYQPYEQPLYPQILQNSYAFVHTNHGLYHGILYAADKQADGELEGITLIQVSRFSRKTEEAAFAANENPISDLSGPLFIRWADVLDINYPPSRRVLEEKREYYEGKLAAYKARRQRRRSMAARLRTMKLRTVD